MPEGKKPEQTEKETFDSALVSTVELYQKLNRIYTKMGAEAARFEEKTKELKLNVPKIDESHVKEQVKTDETMAAYKTAMDTYVDLADQLHNLSRKK